MQQTSRHSPALSVVGRAAGASFLLLFSTFAIAWLGFIFFPAVTQRFVAEDSLVENASAISFLLASVLAVWTLKNNEGYRMYLWTIAAIGLLGFLDEISFGERLFGMSMPYVAGTKIDAAHDFVDLLYRTRGSWACPGDMSCYSTAAIVALVTMASAWFLRDWIVAQYDKVMKHPHWFLLVLFVGLLSVALIIDLGRIDSALLFAFEELIELNAAVLLCICSLCVHKLANGRHFTNQ